MSYSKQTMLANMIGLSEQQLKHLILDFAYPIGSIYMQKKKSSIQMSNSVVSG